MTWRVAQAKVFPLGENGGNPCAVVRGIGNLADKTMQNLARYLGQETVFILPALGADARLRFFSPTNEMEFCAYTTIAAVSLLNSEKKIPASRLMVETKCSFIFVECEHSATDTIVKVEQPAPVFTQPLVLPNEQLISLGLRRDSIDTDVGPIQVVVSSRSKLFIPLRSFLDLDRLTVVPENIDRLCRLYKASGIFPFTLHTRNPEADAEARQFPSGLGFSEDAATGLAAAALAGYFIRNRVFGQPANGWNSFLIEQGHIMGRPSAMRAECLFDKGNIQKTRVCGTAVWIDQEEFILNPPSADKVSP